LSDFGFSQLDSIRIRQTVHSMINAVDLRDFDSALRLFAPRVSVDYTSLWGGELAGMVREDLIRSWRGLLPGFDATWHELGEISVKAQGDLAQASCTVAARHWIGTEVWLPKGRYEFELRKAGAWQITLMRLLMAEELGDRGLVARAQARVKAAS
jgi:hypothetical protein